MIDIVELAREARIVVCFRAEDVAVLLRVDLNAGTRELVEDTRGERAPEIALEGTCFEYAIRRDVLQHGSVEEDARRVDRNSFEIGESRSRCAPRRGGKGSARSCECVECTHIFFCDHLIVWDECPVEIADQEDVIVSFFAHNASISVR